MSFQEFQNGHLGYQIGRILAILNLYAAPMPPIKFQLNLTYCLGGDVGHLGYPNGTILAILNLCVAPMPPIKFRLNLTCGLGGEWPPWRQSWISELNNFSHSESLCHSDASHQVLAQSDLWFGRRCLLKNGGHLGYPNGTILAILNLWVAPMPSIKFRLNLTYGLGGEWPPWWQSWISEWNNFSNSESLCNCDASHQVLAQSDLRFGRRCLLKNFKMAAMAAILDIGTERL